MRATADGKASVATVAAGEPLRAAPPAPLPVTVSEPRTVSAQALVAYRGNRYSVPPEPAGAEVSVAPGSRRGRCSQHHRAPVPALQLPEQAIHVTI